MDCPRQDPPSARIARELTQFVQSKGAVLTARQKGGRNVRAEDYLGEMWQALVRQWRPGVINLPVWVAKNADFHLRNAIRREREW
jgi:hypothetical protein